MRSNSSANAATNDLWSKYSTERTRTKGTEQARPSGVRNAGVNASRKPDESDSIPGAKRCEMRGLSCAIYLAISFKCSLYNHLTQTLFICLWLWHSRPFSLGRSMVDGQRTWRKNQCAKWKTSRRGVAAFPRRNGGVISPPALIQS